MRDERRRLVRHAGGKGGTLAPPGVARGAHAIERAEDEVNAATEVFRWMGRPSGQSESPVARADGAQQCEQLRLLGVRGV